MKRIKGAVVLGAAIAAVGCGGPAAVNAPARASDACSQLTAAAARTGARCNGGTLADWQAFEANGFDCAAYDRHVIEGKVQYRPDLFAACLATYEGLHCDTIVSGNCFADVLHGLVADGQQCADSMVCGPVSACLQLSGNACGEVCARFGNENEGCGLYCGDATPCAVGDACSFPLACVNSVCVKPKAAGAACATADPVPCTFPQFCSADPADPQSTGVCTDRASGGPCRADVECPGVEFCWQGICTPRRARGAACADAPAGCSEWTTCDASGTCAAAGHPGQPCGAFPSSPGFGFCATGACGTDMLCADYAGAGANCLTSTCAVGTSCDLASSVCVACTP